MAGRTGFNRVALRVFGIAELFELVAILARGRRAGSGDTNVLPAVIGMLRVWGATSPVAALRVHEDRGVEWLVTPPLLEETG